MHKERRRRERGNVHKEKEEEGERNIHSTHPHVLHISESFDPLLLHLT